MTYERMIEIISRKSSIPDAGESFDEINEAYDMAIDCLAELKAYREKACRDCSTCARYSEFQKEIPEECKGCKHNYFSNYMEIK